MWCVSLVIVSASQAIGCEVNSKRFYAGVVFRLTVPMKDGTLPVTSGTGIFKFLTPVELMPVVYRSVRGRSPFMRVLD